MFRKCWCVTALLTCFSPGFCHAQDDVSFDYLSLEHGLSQSTVRVICQDSRGFMWFGTNDGLNRYDGYHFRHFHHSAADRDSLSDSRVNALCEGGDGSIWVGTSYGLNRLDLQSGRFERFHSGKGDVASIPHDDIQCLHASGDGRIWIGTRNGLAVYDPGAGKFARFEQDFGNPGALYGKRVFCIIEDRAGAIWVGTSGYHLHRLDRDSGLFERFTLPPDIVPQERLLYWISAAEDRRGRIWVGLGVYGLFTVDLSGHRLVPLRGAFNELVRNSNYAVSSIAQDSAGDLWVGLLNEGGLARISEDGKNFKVYSNRASALCGPRSNYVFAVYRDLCGILWVGTRGGAITKVKRDKFKHLSPDPFAPFSLGFGNVRAIFEDEDGILWVGYLNGLDRIDRTSGTRETLKRVSSSKGEIELRTIFHISGTGDGRLLVGGRIFGLIAMDRERRSCEVLLAGEIARYSLIDKKGNLWIASGNAGVFRIGADEGLLRPPYLLEKPPNLDLVDKFARVLLETPDGILWIGSNEGLYRYDPITGESRVHLPANGDLTNPSVKKINCLELSRTGKLWVGTDSGLFELDRRDNSFTALTGADGLPGETIQAILEDDRGNLWVSTTRGLCKLDGNTHAVQSFDEEDGLQSREFALLAAHRSRAGEMLFGGINGLNIFHPADVSISSVEPAVVITAVRFGGNLLEPLAGFPQGGALELVFDERDLWIEFCGLDYSSPSRIDYRYMLEGFDEDWRDTDSNYVSYTNLPAGDYTFKVKCTNGDGVWGSNLATLRITVLPPYWDTWWFKALLLCVAAGVVFGLSWMRVKAVRLQRDTLRKEVELRTRELREKTLELEKRGLELERRNLDLQAFSYSVSHDLRTPLHSISGYCKIIGDELATQLGEQGNEYLDRIHSAARRMSALIDDLLLFSVASQAEIGRTDIDLSLIAREVIYGLAKADPKRTVDVRITDRLSCRGDYRLVQSVLENLLGNAWKYTGKMKVGLVEFGAREVEGERVFFVRDDGVGFEPENAEIIFQPFQRLHPEAEFEGTGIGLATVKRIVERHGGRIWAEGRPCEGATFYFTL